MDHGERGTNKEWELTSWGKKKKKKKKWEPRKEKKGERGKSRVCGDQISGNTLITSVPNIKVDNKIICEIKPWLYLLIASYVI